MQFVNRSVARISFNLYFPSVVSILYLLYMYRAVLGGGVGESAGI